MEKECKLKYHVKDCYASSFTTPFNGNEISASWDDNSELSSKTFRNEELDISYNASISGKRSLGNPGFGTKKEISFVYKAHSIGTNTQNILACFLILICI